MFCQVSMFTAFLIRCNEPKSISRTFSCCKTSGIRKCLRVWHALVHYCPLLKYHLSPIDPSLVSLILKKLLWIYLPQTDLTPPSNRSEPTNKSGQVQCQHLLQPTMPKEQYNPQIRTGKGPKHISSLPTHRPKSESNESERRTEIPTQKEGNT